MQEAPDTQRLRALKALDAMQDDIDPKFASIVQVARQWFDVPMVSITMVDADRQYRMAHLGPLAREGGLDGAICPVAMEGEDALVVTDTTRDPRFAESPYVTGDPRLRFYAGWPLHAPGGEAVGAFCVMDTRPRVFEAADELVLADLGRWIERELHAGVRAPVASCARGLVR